MKTVLSSAFANVALRRMATSLFALGLAVAVVPAGACPPCPNPPDVTYTTEPYPVCKVGEIIKDVKITTYYTIVTCNPYVRTVDHTETDIIDYRVATASDITNSSLCPPPPCPANAVCCTNDGGGAGGGGGGCPTCKQGGGGSGPAAGDPVNLATGEENYQPSADITVYNPVGPAVTFRRLYRSGQAQLGTSSLGFGPGWFHNYDITLVASSTSTWGALTLTRNDGNTEPLTPVTDSNGNLVKDYQGNYDLNVQAGDDCYVRGVPSTTTGVWNSVTIMWGDQTQWTFTPAGSSLPGLYQLTQITNRVGRSILLNWDSTTGRLTSITDDTASHNVLLSLAYDGNGNLSTVTDSTNRVVGYSFGVVPQGTTSIEELLKVSQLGQGSAGATHYTYGYDANQPLLTSISVPNPVGDGTGSTATIHYTQDSSGIYQVDTLTDANGNKHVYTYGGGAAVQVEDSSGTVIQHWQQNTTADGLNNGVVNAAGNSTSYQYNAANNPDKPSQFTDYDGAQTTYTYDGFGHVLTETDPGYSQNQTVTTTYTYNYPATFPLGRLMEVQRGTQTPTNYTYYEPQGLIHTITAPMPGSTTGQTVTTTYTYDSLGNILTISGPGNNAASTITTTYNYTADGSYTPPDAVGEPITVTDNLGHITHFRYDGRGNPSSVTDALGNETDTGYNVADQVTSVTYPSTTGPGRAQETQTYLYPGGPLMAKTTFDEAIPANQVQQITYSYGKEGELLSQGSCCGGGLEPVSYTYDALYRRETLTDGSGNTTYFFYDNVGNLSEVDYPGAASHPDPTIGDRDTIHYTSYDPVGRPLTRVDGNNVTTNSVYNDPAGVLTDIQYPATPGLNVHYTYDTYGRRASITDGSGSTAYNRYDDLGNLLTVITTYTGVPAQTITHAFYPDGSRQTMTTPGGTFAYDYDAAGRLGRLISPAGVTSWSYYDNNLLSGQTLANGVGTSYTYNARNLLTSLVNKANGGATLSSFTNMTYDPMRDRTAMTVAIPGLPAYGGTTGYSYTTRQQITQENSTRNGGYVNNFVYDSGTNGAGNPTTFKSLTPSYNADNQLSGASFVYDGNGNPTTYNGQAGVTYDPENRMTKFGTVTYGYNGDGLRAWKTDSNGTTYYLYDGDLLVCEFNAAGAVTATDTFGAAGLVARTTPAGSTYYQFDPQGSTVQTLDANSNVLSTCMFDSWGSQICNNGGPAGVYGYDAQWGYYTDTDTGLVLLTHRYYDPAYGRFLTRDPIGYKGGVNLYGYTRENPVNRLDPEGFDPTNPDDVQEYNTCVSEALRLFHGCIGDVMGGSIGSDALNCLAGCGIACAWSGEATFPVCGLGCGVGAGLGTLASLMIARHYCAAPYAHYMGVCKQILNRHCHHPRH